MGSIPRGITCLVLAMGSLFTAYLLLTQHILKYGSNILHIFLYLMVCVIVCNVMVFHGNIIDVGFMSVLGQHG